MPEGDTVWLHARRLDEALHGRELVATDFRLPALATTDLTGWRVAEVTSRGKHLLHRFVAPTGDRWTLHSHLRMDGTWRTFAPGEHWRGRPMHTVRVVLRTADRVAVGFHIHDVSLVPTDDEHTLVGHLGPDLLGPDWDAVEAVRRLRIAPEREIATALLDQRNFAGIGNLYKAEVLFLRGIWPWRTVAEVNNLEAVVDLARRLLYANRERWPQITTGDTRRGRQTYVFERSGHPCLRCGTLVRQARQGTGYVEDRVTFWCPSCQPATESLGAS